MKLDWFVAVYDTKYSKESVTNPWPRNSMSWSLPLKLWKLFHAINFGWTEDSRMAAGGNNQRLTSPSCNPLRLAKHAVNDRSNFHYCKTFIYELCRCQSTLIFETVKAKKKNLWIARGSLPSSGFDHSSTIWYILPPLLCGIIMSESVFLIMSEKTVFVKFIR